MNETAFFKKEMKLAIKDLLKEHEELRDNDDLLFCRLIEDKEEQGIQLMSATDLLEKLKIRYYTTIESVTRARRKWQEEVPSLRGKLYEKRHKRQRSVIEELDAWVEEEDE